MRVFCLGLGRPSLSKDARAQLAFLITTCDALALVGVLHIIFATRPIYPHFRLQDRSRIAAYDPVFTLEDVNLLAGLGVSSQVENQASIFDF